MLTLAAPLPAAVEPKPDPFETLGHTQVEPIVFKEGAHLRRERLALHHAWYERVVLAPFRERMVGTPWETLADRFVTSAIDDLYLPKDSGSVARLLQEGKQVLEFGCRDILPLYLVERLNYRTTGATAEAKGRLAIVIHTHRSDPGVTPVLLSLMGRELISLQSVYEVDEGFVPQVIGWIKKALKDGSYAPGDGTIFIEQQLTRDWDYLHLHYAPKLKEVYAEAPFEPWAMHTLEGAAEHAIAWDVRTHFYKQPAEARERLTERFQTAREELAQGWQLNPAEAHAAVLLISLVGAGYGTEDDSTRLWFDRAVAAEFDQPTAYRYMLRSLKTSWGGNIGDVLAFGIACAETRRFETIVPDQFFNAYDLILAETGDWRRLHREPALAEPYIALCQAAMASPARAHERDRWAQALAVAAWGSGDFRLAAETLAKLPKLSADHFSLREITVSDALIRAETSIGLSPAQARFAAGESAYARQDLATAKAEFEAAAQLAPPEAQAFLASRLAVVEIETALATRDWVKITPKPGLLEWGIDAGNWSVDEQGRLINKGEATGALTHHLARVGPELELRAEVEFPSLKNQDHATGLVFGYHRPGYKKWASCGLRLGPEKGRALILDDFRDSRARERAFQPAKKLSLLLHAAGGSITLTCNGEKIFDHADPQQAEFDAPDGRIGFGTYFFPRGDRSVISNIEVRRLPPSRE